MEEKRVPVSCNRDCGAGCPLIAIVRDGKVDRIIDNPDRPEMMRGCERGYRYMKYVYSRDRITVPLRRSGERGSGRYTEISWQDAIDSIAKGLGKALESSGPSSIFHLGGSGSCRGAVHHTGRLSMRFLNLLGGYYGTDGNYSSAATSFAVPYVYGTGEVGSDPATFSDSRLIVLWGANICDTRFGCQLEGYIRQAKNAGTPVIVIDPRKSRTVDQLASEWIPIYPGTDAVFMTAVLWALITEQYIDKKYIHTYCTGFDKLTAYVLGEDDGVAKTPEWAEEICGTPAERIRRFARLYGENRPAALIPGLSIQRTVGGEEAARLAAVLQSVTGNTGIRGGSSGGNIWVTLPQPRCGKIDILDNGNMTILPVYVWSDAVLQGSSGGYPGDARFLYNVGGNYILQGSDIAKNIQAFMQTDFSVCHDHFLTPTARYCDIILPATTFLEREDILFPGLNYLFYSGRAVAPAGKTKNDYEIFSLLAEKLGIKDEFTEGKDERQWLDACLGKSEVVDTEAFKRTGIYTGEGQERTGLSRFIEDPEGSPLPTDSGLIELCSEKYHRDTGFPAVPIPRYEMPEGLYPLRMSTPHAKYRVNSQNGNIPHFFEKDPQRLLMHRQDASERNISDNEEVKVYSSVGETVVRAMVTDRCMQGVVVLHQGAWPAFSGSVLQHRENPNFCTSSVPTRPSNGSRTHTVFVQVEKMGDRE